VKRNQSSRLGKDKQHEDQVKVKTKMYPSKKKIKIKNLETFSKKKTSQENEIKNRKIGIRIYYIR
jgi:hypothetical protein